MIVAIDFDGTIVQDRYPAIGVMQPYAKDVIRRMYEDGHYIILWTSRSGDALLGAINYLLDKGIPFHRVNDSEPANRALYDTDTRKIYADVYIDDKIVGGFPGWQAIEAFIYSKDSNQ